MAEILEEIQYQDPVPKPTLSKEHRAKLDSIVHQMVTNKESDSTIQSVVNDFKSKYIGAPETPTAKQPTAEFKQMTDWLKIPEGGYQPIMQDAVVDNSHFKNTNQAADRINKSLEVIDPHIKNLLYDVKKDLQGRLKSQQLAVNPTENQILNPQAALIESQLREEPKVEDKEVEQYKVEMGGNVNMVRNALKRQVHDLSKTDPERANQIKADVYRLDRQEYPAKEEKISKNIEKLKDGTFDYDIKRGILTKPEGFFGSLVTGFKHKNQLFKDYEFYKSTDDQSKIIRELNKKIDETDADEAVPVADGFLGEAGAMIGGQPIKPVVGGVIAGAFTTPAGGAVAGGAIASHEMYKLGYAAALPQNYAAIKRENPDMPDDEAYLKAKDLTENQAITDAVSGGAMGLIGLRIGLKPTGISLAFQKSLRSGLRQLAKAGVEKGIEGLIGGEVGAIGQQIKNVMAQKAGIPVDTDEGVIEQLVSGVGMTMGMALLKFPKLLKPSTYRRLSYEMSKMPDEVITQEAQRLQESGYATPEEIQGIQNEIKSQREINNSIRGNMPESERIKVQEKINKRNELEAEMEVADKAFHPELKEKIKQLNEEIVAISKGSDKGELQKIVDKADIKGNTSEILKNASEKDLKEYFKEIAEQAHDPNSAKLTIETFGEEIVNKAKDLYPTKEVAAELKVIQEARAKDINDVQERIKVAAEEEIPALEKEIDGINEYYDKQIEVAKGRDKIGMQEEAPITPTDKKSGISVIQPEEIKRPETITIKPKENESLPIEKPDGVDVPTQAGDGEAMGAGNTQPEIPTGEKGQPTIQEGAPKSEEGKVGEPEMIGITHAQTDEIARRLGFDTYEKDPESLALWDKQAKERFAKDPDALNKLIQKLRSGDGVDKVETRMMIMHLADLMGKYEANPTPELLNQIKRTTDLFDISGREKGKELVARKGVRPADMNTLSGYHLQDVEWNKGAPLTEEQTRVSTKEYNEIKATKEALEQKVAKLEADAMKAKAEKKVEAEAKSAKKSGQKDYKTERKQILDDIANKWKKSSKENLGASFVPYAKELAAIAPDVMKLVKNLVEEGVEKLPDVIKAVHKQIKDIIPNVTEKDVHDIIAGEYNPKKETRNQLAEQLYNLRKEAKLMNELDQLINGEVPKNEKRQIARNQRIEELRSQIKELKDEMGLNERTMDEKLASLKGRYKSKIKEVEDKIAKGDYGPDEKPQPIELDAEGKELRDKYLALKEERALRLLEQEYGNRSTGEKALGVVSKALKTGRTLKSSFDVSYPFRQTIVGLSRELFSLPFTKKNGKWEFNNFQGQRNLKEQFSKMYQSFGSERAFRATMDDIHNNPRYEMSQKAGLDFADPISNLDRAKEEMFQNSYAEKIPGVKVGVKASHRAATVIANKMKWDIFNELVDKFESQGKTFENSKELYEATAKYANQLVGRGILGEKLEMAAPVISHFVYSLRLYASRLQLLTYLVNPKFYTKVPKEIRIEYLKDMTKFVALGGSIMGLAAASGLGVGLNPYNSDFGTITAGNTKYDIWGGFKQYAVLLSRILAGKQNSDKDLRDLFSDEDFDRNEKTRGDILLRFLRTKASPELGTVIDITTGKGFDNKPVTLKSAAADYFTPLLYKDVQAVYQDAGVTQALLTFLLASHGVGTQTYGDSSSSSSGGGNKSSGRPHKQGKPTKHSKNTKK